jgi:hypothetical protein
MYFVNCHLSYGILYAMRCLVTSDDLVKNMTEYKFRWIWYSSWATVIMIMFDTCLVKRNGHAKALIHVLVSYYWAVSHVKECFHKCFNISLRNCTLYSVSVFDIIKLCFSEFFFWGYGVTSDPKATLRSYNHSTWIWFEKSFSTLLTLSLLMVNVQGRKLG